MSLHLFKAISFLNKNDFLPLGHVHTGNIFIETVEEGKEVCQLGGYENTLLGYKSNLLGGISKNGTLAKIDIVMFGKLNVRQF